MAVEDEPLLARLLGRILGGAGQAVTLVDTVVDAHAAILTGDRRDGVDRESCGRCSDCSDALTRIIHKHRNGIVGVGPINADPDEFLSTRTTLLEQQLKLVDNLAVAGELPDAAMTAANERDSPSTSLTSHPVNRPETPPCCSPRFSPTRLTWGFGKWRKQHPGSQPRNSADCRHGMSATKPLQPLSLKSSTHNHGNPSPPGGATAPPLSCRGYLGQWALLH